MATQTWTESETTCDNCGAVIIGRGIVEPQAWSLVCEGGRYDFCSEECADEFLAAERKEEQDRAEARERGGV